MSLNPSEFFWGGPPGGGFTGMGLPGIGWPGIDFPPGEPIIVQPTPIKMIVVAQNPASGQQVPLGTLVDFTLAVKDDLAIAAIAKSPNTSTKWPTVRDLNKFLASQPVLKSILGSVSDYSKLGTTATTTTPANAKPTVDTILLAQFPDPPAPGKPITDRPKIYNDMAFAYTL